MLEVAHSNQVPVLVAGEIEGILPFAFHINTGGYNIVSWRKPWGNSVGVEQTPVFEVSVAIGQQDIDQQTPGELLYIRQTVTGKLCEHPANLFVVGCVIFFLRVFNQDLSKVFHMNALTRGPVKALNG